MEPKIDDFYKKIGKIMGHELSQQERDKILILVKKIRDDEQISLREAFIWALGIYSEMGGR